MSIDIFTLDNQETIKIRLARAYNTLPKYLYNISEDNKKAKDLLEKIKKDADKNTEFKTFYEKYKDSISLSPKDILKPWLSLNKNLENISLYNSSILTNFAESLVNDGYIENKDEFDSIWRERKNFNRELEKDIQKNIFEDDRNIKLYKTFEEVEDGLVYTDFKTERILLSVDLDIKNTSILEIFNSIILKDRIPFAVCKDYYKILKDFTPSEDWVSKTDNIIFKMFEKTDIDPKKYKEYTDIILSVDGKLGYEDVKVDMKLITQKGYLTKDEFIKNFLSVFNTKIGYKNINEKEVAGIFNFPRQRLNLYILSDLIMNNQIFSSLINIDESMRATKKKTDTNIWLYIHFNHPSTGHLTASITQKIGDRNDPSMREEDPEIFPHGEPYIKVRAKGRDIKSIGIFQDILGKLLVLYEKEFDNIVSIYEQYIPDFGVFEEYDVGNVKKQTDIAPEIFVKNYSRYCPSDRIPKIISDKEAKKYDGDIMIFPRENGNWETKYPSDGRNPKNYTCQNPDFPYPGLQVNNLQNSSEYPFLPCCFKNPQDKPGSIYRHYFYDEPLEQKTKKQQELIKTGKILEMDKYGLLPEGLQKIFDIIDPDYQYKYIRIGVSRSPSSFILAVMTALHDITGILESSNRELKAEKIRKSIISKGLENTCRQCAYDMTEEQVKKLIENTEAYFDPKIFIQTLEEYFNCNIYLFNNDMMFLPKFLGAYYRKSRENVPYVFIYENWGSESDRLKYPQSEIIVKWNTKKKDDTQYYFNSSEKISKNINKIFKLLNESYVLNKKINDIVFPIENLEIKSQTIDSYGKCREISVFYNGENINIILEPICPLGIKQENIGVIQNDFNIVEKFLKNKGLRISGQDVSGNKTIGITFKIGNVDCYISVYPMDKLEGIPLEHTMIYKKDEKSSLYIFNMNKKISRYIIEYTFWRFSNYIHDNKIENINDKVLAKFSEKHFEIIPNHEYGIISKNFGKNNTVIKDNKIIVQSLDMIKRLMYVLKLSCIREPEIIFKYWQREVISQYYIDITDFDNHPNQVILKGSGSIDKWLTNLKTEYKFYKNINIGQKSPYFFKNENIDIDKIFLAQNGNSLENALAISLAWKNNGFNTGTFIEDVKARKYSFKLYSYKSPDEIESYDVNGEKNMGDIRIVGYKIQGTSYFTALLDLE